MSDRIKEADRTTVELRNGDQTEVISDEDILSDKDVPPFDPNRISFFKDRFVLSTIIGIIALDQTTKLLIRSYMEIGSSWPATGWVRITHGINTGSAFGLFPNQTEFLLLASVIAIGFLVYFYRTHVPPKLTFKSAVGLQLGGAIGNLIDRIRNGAVTDFVDVGPWPIFNVADSAIVIGVIVLLVAVLFGGDIVDRPKHPEVIPRI